MKVERITEHMHLKWVMNQLAGYLTFTSTRLQESLGKIKSLRVDLCDLRVAVLKFAKKKIHHGGTESTERSLVTALKCAANEITN